MDLTLLDANENAVLLDISGKLCGNRDTQIQNGSFLRKNPATADGACVAVKKGRQLVGGRSLVGKLVDGNHLLVGKRLPVFPRPELTTNVCSVGEPVSTRIVERLA